MLHIHPGRARQQKRNLPGVDRPATLKMHVDHLDLSPATVSIVLNNSPATPSIPRPLSGADVCFDSNSP
jgi:hypothetical protein